MNELFTTWGETLKAESELHKEDAGYTVLSEYPRPQMKRDNYTVLNGWWKYAIRGKHCTDPLDNDDWDGQILVPFSPESPLSGVKHVLTPHESLWYERSFSVKYENGKRLLLHFGAVDQVCEVYLNGKKVAEHDGGYLPFTIDATKYLKENNIIRIKVLDETDHCERSRGKQMLRHHGMFYTPQSGIWQTVWYEWVPATYIESLNITPYFDKRSVEVELHIKGDEEKTIKNEYIIDENEFHPWTPDDPYLYEKMISYGNDNVQIYFAMRCFTKERDELGVWRLCLNHKPVFMDGVLDQGYWPDGLMTAPSDEALVFDITEMKRTGFNMIRKHIKIEPLRWYYHCDRLGMLVWQDMVNGGGPYNALKVTYIPTVFTSLQAKLRDDRYMYFARTDRKAKAQWVLECKETVRYLYNIPSIALWTPFNEGWGQFDALKVTKYIREIDKTRLVDHASGWADQGGGDVKSIHNYFGAFTLAGIKEENRAIVYSEYGGFACLLPEHSSPDKLYGYRNYATTADLRKAYDKVKRDLFAMIPDGLCAGVFTQVSDIEDEVNGVLTYDRKINKLLE